MSEIAKKIEKFIQKRFELKSEKKEPDGSNGIKYVIKKLKHAIWILFLFCIIIFSILKNNINRINKIEIAPNNPCSDKNSKYIWCGWVVEINLE